MGVSGGIPAAEANERAREYQGIARELREDKRKLAIALLSLAETAGMPDSFWTTDSRVRLALDALWPGMAVSRPWVRMEAGL